MGNILLILITLVAFGWIPLATILGWFGYWIFDFWGALIGVFVGLFIQVRN
jgi:hypothetical protein